MLFTLTASRGRTWLLMVGFGLLMGVVFPFFSSLFFGSAAFRLPYAGGCLLAGVLVGNFCFWLFNQLYRRHMERETAVRRTLEDNERHLRRLAFTDPLTRLPNRAAFYDRLDKMLADAHSCPREIALLFLDLDRFKKINDTLGHGIGDQILRIIGARLQKLAGPQIQVARLGGDEFVLLQDGVTSDRLEALVQQVLEDVARPVCLQHYDLFVRASIGVSLYPHQGTNRETLVKHADIAMYQAKEQGGHCVQFYVHNLARRATEMLVLESSLHKALDLGQFRLSYQPQVEMTTGRVVGAEVLLRWHHPELGVVGPAEFIPVAEETGLIVPIGAWVIRTACVRAMGWRRQTELPLKISLNISARQLAESDLVPVVRAALEESGLPPEALTLEVTESMVIGEEGRVVEALDDLQRLGVVIALDDFGTGYSSLNYLRRLPISVLKIDRSYVVDAEREPRCAAVLDAIIHVAGQLEQEVVVEGVETLRQVHLLLNYGCRLAQGYYFGRPMTEEALLALAHTGVAPVALPQPVWSN